MADARIIVQLRAKAIYEDRAGANVSIITQLVFGLYDIHNRVLPAVVIVLTVAASLTVWSREVTKSST